MSRACLLRLRAQEGFTLVEMLVVIAIFSILAVLMFAVVINTSGNARAVRQATDLNEESRVVMNRISRELRQAARIVSVVNPDAVNADGSERLCTNAPPPCFDPSGKVAVTFQVDFNNNGSIETSGADPEQLTYCYDQPNQRLLLQTTSGLNPDCPGGGASTYPILSANVTGFKLTYRSSDYRCDVNSDGTVTWQEVETAANPCPANAGDLIGGKSALDAELGSVDHIIIELTVLTPPRTQRYRTKIDLRNQF